MEEDGDYPWPTGEYDGVLPLAYRCPVQGLEFSL